MIRVCMLYVYTSRRRRWDHMFEYPGGRVGEVKVPSARVGSCVEVSAAQSLPPWSWASSGSGDAVSVRMAS